MEKYEFGRLDIHRKVKDCSWYFNYNERRKWTQLITAYHPIVENKSGRSLAQQLC